MPYKNLEDRRAKNRRYFALHRERIHEKHRLYYVAHRKNYLAQKIENDTAFHEAIKERLRKRRYEREYGITWEEFQEKIEQQMNTCSICKITFSKEFQERPVMDHDHRTGKLRSVLCRSCNNMLGFARDNTFILQQGMVYLNEHR